MLWITFPSDWPDPATSETLWPGSWPLSVRGASVCWFGLRVPTCRKTHGEEEACPRQNIVRRPKPTSSYLQSVTLRVSLLQRYLDLYVLPEIQEMRMHNIWLWLIPTFYNSLWLMMPMMCWYLFPPDWRKSLSADIEYWYWVFSTKWHVCKIRILKKDIKTLVKDALLF